MSTRIADIICIAQITFKIIHSALLVYDGQLLFLHFNCVFDLSAGVNMTDLGVSLSAETTFSLLFLLSIVCMYIFLALLLYLHM